MCDGEVNLVGAPIVGEVGGCDGGRVGYVAGVQDEYIPGAHFSSDLMHRLVVSDISGEGQADGAVAVRLYNLFCLGERGICATDQD